MNSARRWPSAKPTRNPHGVKEKEVLFFEGEFPQLHSISFLFPIFYLNLPPPTPLSIFQTHIFSIFLISLSNPPHIPLRASRTENSFSFQLYFPLFPNLKSASSLSILFVLSFYPLQLIALVPGPFRIVSSDLPCPI